MHTSDAPDNASAEKNKSGRRAMPKPLDAARLRALALRYVERYQTSEAKLERYLERKLRERGWSEEAEAPDIAAVVAAMADYGFVDDASFAEARVRGLLRRGMGGRRIREDLRASGIATEISDHLLEGHDEREAAISYARRKRLGPFGTRERDARLRKRELSSMLCAGHPFDVARAIIDAESEDDLPAD